MTSGGKQYHCNTINETKQKNHQTQQKIVFIIYFNAGTLFLTGSGVSL
jgi:hypothetical protein